MRKVVTRVLAVALLIATASLFAHDLYILPERFIIEPGQPLLVAFHNGDSFPISEASPVLERIRDTNMISAAGTIAMRGLKVDGNKATGTAAAPSAGEFLLTVRTIPNFLQSDPTAFLSYLKEEGLLHVIDWRARRKETQKPGRERYSKYAKSLLLAGATDGFFSHEAGFPIEIVPESDPYRAKPGDNLAVRVVFQGKPAADVQLEAAWADGQQSKTTIAGRTDSGGRIAVHLDRPGLWRLHTLKMEPCAEPAVADWESYWASLTFELP